MADIFMWPNVIEAFQAMKFRRQYSSIILLVHKDGRIDIETLVDGHMPVDASETLIAELVKVGHAARWFITTNLAISNSMIWGLWQPPPVTVKDRLTNSEARQFLMSSSLDLGEELEPQGDAEGLREALATFFSKHPKSF